MLVPAPPKSIAQKTAPPPSAATRAARPRSSPRRRWIIRILIVLVSASAIDALFIEPFRIEVTRHQVRMGSPAAVGAPLKIAHLSDLHTRGIGRRERRLLALLETEKPDLIVVTGDTLYRGGSYAAVRDLLSQLHAPLGVWVVRGNAENSKPLKSERPFYAAAGVHFLMNEAHPVREGIWVAGLDDPSSGSPDPVAALRGVPPGAYTILLFHAPGYFRQVAGHSPLVLAGHTHGGQVRLPFLPVLWLPRGSRPYVAGWYESSVSRMYVSRGIGTSVLPVRFFCRPELALITLEP